MDPLHDPPQSLSIAILYTGQIRTLLQTIEAFRKNVIEPNQNHSIHIYTCLEYPESLPNQIDIQQYKKDIQQIFHDQFHNHLISMCWISSKDPLCRFVREKTVENMPISDLWKDYLCNRSGSITEYYQLYKGYEQIEEYSQKHQITYDLFIRTRCDIMIPQPLDFDSFHYSPTQITKRYQTLQQALPHATTAHLIALYITTISQTIDKAIERITTPHFTLESFYNQNSVLSQVYDRYLNPKHPDNHNLTIDEITSFIEMILPCTRITYRQNLFYMGLIHNGITEKNIILNYRFMNENRIKYTYSHHQKERTIEGEQYYWFNAENMYQLNVIEKQLLIVNSYTENEEKSLYDNYQEKGTEIFYLLR
jgi:hypothetical protein